MASLPEENEKIRKLGSIISGSIYHNIVLCLLSQDIYDELCHDLNKTSQPSFVTLAEEMGYVREDILRFKKSSNPADAMLNEWELNPGNDVPKLIKLLKKIRRVDLAKTLQVEVIRIVKMTMVLEAAVRLGHLKELTYVELCDKLNRQPQKNFVPLAVEMGYVRGDIDRFMESDSPADAMFRHWEKKPENDVLKLIMLLKNTGQVDLAGMLEEEVSKVREEREFSETQKTEENSVGSDEEEKRESEESSDTSDEDGHTFAEERTGCRISNERCISLSPKGLKIGQLDPRVHVKLRLELNKSVPGRDYIALAGTMGYNWDDVEIFQLKPDPSNALLCDWKTKPGNDVLGLIKLLREIERDDLAEFLEENTDGRGQLNSGVKRASCRDVENYGSKKSRRE